MSEEVICMSTDGQGQDYLYLKLLEKIQNSEYFSSSAIEKEHGQP